MGPSTEATLYVLGKDRALKVWDRRQTDWRRLSRKKAFGEGLLRLFRPQSPRLITQPRRDGGLGAGAMNSPSLREFVSDAVEAQRIRFGDLRRLQRDILPARIATREEVEMLVDLDRSVRTADRDWTTYLVTTVRDFVVWGMPPAGVVDHDKAEWLIATLSNGGVTKTGRAIAREVFREARQIDRALARRAGAPEQSVKHFHLRL